MAHHSLVIATIFFGEISKNFSGNKFLYGRLQGLYKVQGLLTNEPEIWTNVCHIVYHLIEEPVSVPLHFQIQVKEYVCI